KSPRRISPGAFAFCYSRSALLLARACLESSGDRALDPATHVEVTDNFHPARLARFGQIVEDAIHGALVENAVVAKAPEIQLEALELETLLRGRVRDEDGSEIRRATLQQLELGRIAFDSTHRTERRELVALHLDLVFAIRVRIIEGLQQFSSWH